MGAPEVTLDPFRTVLEDVLSETGIHPFASLSIKTGAKSSPPILQVYCSYQVSGAYGWLPRPFFYACLADLI